MIVARSVSHKARGCRFLAFLLLGLLAVACGGGEIALPSDGGGVDPPPQSTAAPATVPPVQRPTLPPTWTPTPTFTPLPPSPTPTITLTPSVTPTWSVADRCARFWLYSRPREGAQLALREYDAVGFAWQYPLAGEAITLTVQRLGHNRARSLTLTGPRDQVVTVPFAALYGPGPYHWTVTPVDADGQPVGDCAVTGRFALVSIPREAHAWPTPEPIEMPVLDDPPDLAR